MADEGRVHARVMAGFVERGYAPTVDELAAELEASREEIERALRALHDAHGLVLHPGTHDVWIAHPFSGSPTAVWVDDAARGRGWWAPCLWCAAGVVELAAPAAAEICVRYGGETEAARVGAEALVHFAIPPRDAWANVVHWCATVLPFRDARECDAWCARHRLPRGELVPWATVVALGRAWYGRHLDETWRKWTLAEAQAIFASVGLVGEHWRLPVGDQRF